MNLIYIKIFLKSGKIPNHDNILNAVRMPSWKWNTHSMHGLFALFGWTFCTGVFKHIVDIILDRVRMPSWLLKYVAMHGKITIVPYNSTMLEMLSGFGIFPLLKHANFSCPEKGCFSEQLIQIYLTLSRPGVYIYPPICNTATAL